MAKALGWIVAITIPGVVILVVLVQLGVVTSPLAAQTHGEVDAARSAVEGVRVLFVGNSLTFTNDMPNMVSELARHDEGSPRVITVQRTRGGARLRDFANDEALIELLDEVDWDFVVLQEQSQLPARPAAERAAEFDPHVRRLAEAVRDGGAEPLLFLTWGWRDGVEDDDSFHGMQDRLRDGYERAARQAGVEIVPVGTAWEKASRQADQLELWQDDGRHPAPAGSFLAACMFFRAVTGRDASASSYDGGLTDGQAAALKELADRVTADAR